MRLRPRLVARTAAAALVIVLAGPAAPAFADPAGPTDYRSVVDGIDPDTDAVAVSVVGGDSFLQVDVRPGHEVVILGYWDEPYARITKDGVVEVNAASPSVLQNTSRYGVATEDAIEPGGQPRWEPTGDHVSFVWHDHRSHWMAPSKATTTGDDGLVQHWELPLVVDGQPTTVTGSLYRQASPGSWWWLVVVAAAALTLALPAARAPIVAGLGLLATSTGLIDRLSLPAAARPGWTPIALGAAAALAGAAAIVGRTRWWSGAALAGGGSALVVLGLVQRPALSHALVPGPTPDVLIRLITAAALGAGVIAVATGALAATGIRLGSRGDPGRHPIPSQVAPEAGPVGSDR